MRICKIRRCIHILMIIITVIWEIGWCSFSAFAENVSGSSNITTDGGYYNTTNSSYNTESIDNGTILVDENYVDRFIESFPEKERPFIEIALIVLCIAIKVFPIVLIISIIYIVASLASRIHSSYEAKKIMRKIQKRDKESKTHEK